MKPISLLKRSMAALVAVLCLTGAIAVPAMAEATARAPKCAAELDLTVPTEKEAAEQTPVVMVHGFTGSPRTWTDGLPSMKAAITQIDEVKVANLFNYGSASTDWVTEGDTAHRLARTIVCAYKLYGNKRVILLAHSMGGLLARAALSWAADGVFAKKATGLVITLGTPHKGLAPANLSYAANLSLCNITFAWWGKEARENCERVEGSKATSAMRPGSPQLAALPKFPDGVAVKAIAGEVKEHVLAIWGYRDVSYDGDLSVSVESATAEYTETGRGDGKKVFGCYTMLAVPRYAPDIWCEHTQMPRAPQVQSEVKRSIQEYLASLNRSKGKLVTAFGHLTLRIPDRLDLKPFHGEGYSSYELMCGDTLGGQNSCPKLSVYNPREAGSGDLGWRSWGWKEECGADKPVRSGVLPIGGHPARAYTAGRCRFWEMNDNSAFIYATDPPGSKQASVVDGVVATATWN